SPLAFTPSIQGQFIWLSTRSGTFTPKGMLPLGTKFQISLLSGLKDLSGHLIFSAGKETAETPPMRVKGVTSLTFSQENDAPALPRYLVLLNANVNAASCARFIRFVNASGAKVNAKVGQAGDPENRVRPFPIYHSDDRSLSIWGEVPPPPSETTDSGD